MINRYRSVLLLGGLLLGVSACGGGNPAATNTTAPTPAVTVAAGTTIAQAQPTTGATDSAAPSAAPSVTETTPDSTATAVVARPNSPYAGLSQSKTAEGYYVLGEPNAPVVMNHYSDFL